jgi:hypothetical protein
MQTLCQASPLNKKPERWVFSAVWARMCLICFFRSFAEKPAK